MYANIIWITAGYFLGIASLRFINLWVLSLFAIILLIPIIIMKFILKRKVLRYVLFLLALILGSVNYADAVDIERTELYDFNDKYVMAYGNISELPTVYSHQIDDGKENKYYEYIVDVKQITYKGEITKCHDRIRVGSDQPYEYGAKIAAKGFLMPIEKKMNSNSRDKRLYYKSKGIFYRMTAYEILPWDIEYTPVSIRHVRNLAANRISKFIDIHYTDRAQAFLKAVLFGDGTHFDEEYNELLKDSGAKRLLYTPFLHITLILGILGIVFSIVPIDRKRRDMILALILIVYIMFNGTSPIFLKLPVFIIFAMYQRNVQGYLSFPQVLAASMLVVALIEPLCLFDAGFVISFTATILLYLFSDKVQELLRFIRFRKLRSLVASWLILTIGTLPLCMYYFNSSAVYSILCTMFFAPLVLLLLVVTPFVFLFVVCFGRVYILGSFQGMILWLMDKFPLLINKLPIAVLRSGQPMLSVVALYYLFLAFVRMLMDGNGKSFQATILRAMMLGFSVSIALSVVSDIGVLKMTFVNVGQGDAAILHIPFRDTVLIDGGGGAPYSDYNIGKNIYLPYLRSEGLYRIDAVIVSHYHKDHCEGIVEAVRHMRVRKLLMPACTPNDKYRILLEQAAAETGTEIEYISSETTLQFHSGLRIHIISPDMQNPQTEDLNDTSLIAEVTYGDFSALFTGDITESTEERLLQRGAVHKETVLKVPHHGSAKSSSPAFVRTVNPDYAVICVGARNNYGMPAIDCMQRYEDIGSQILRTDLNGDIIFSVTKHGLKRITTFTQEEDPYGNEK